MPSDIIVIKLYRAKGWKNSAFILLLSADITSHTERGSSYVSYIQRARLAHNILPKQFLSFLPL
jgi:hypothetical protein